MTTVAVLLPILKAHQDILISIHQIQTMEKTDEFTEQLSGQLYALEQASRLIEESLESLLASTVTVQYYYSGSIE